MSPLTPRHIGNVRVILAVAVIIAGVAAYIAYFHGEFPRPEPKPNTRVYGDYSYIVGLPVPGNGTLPDIFVYEGNYTGPSDEEIKLVWHEASSVAVPITNVANGAGIGIASSDPQSVLAARRGSSIFLYSGTGAIFSQAPLDGAEASISSAYSTPNIAHVGDAQWLMAFCGGPGRPIKLYPFSSAQRLPNTPISDYIGEDVLAGHDITNGDYAVGRVGLVYHNDRIVMMWNRQTTPNSPTITTHYLNAIYYQDNLEVTGINSGTLIRDINYPTVNLGSDPSLTYDGDMYYMGLIESNLPAGSQNPPPDFQLVIYQSRDGSDWTLFSPSPPPLSGEYSNLNIIALPDGGIFALMTNRTDVLSLKFDGSVWTVVEGNPFGDHHPATDRSISLVLRHFVR